jgi:hypothetical protein
MVQFTGLMTNASLQKQQDKGMPVLSLLATISPSNIYTIPQHGMDKVACTDEQIVCGVSLKLVVLYIHYLSLPVSWRPSVTCLHTEISPLWLQNSMHAYIHLAIHIIAFEILTKRSQGGIKEWHIWHFHRCFNQRQTDCSLWFDLCTHKTITEPGSWCLFWFSSSL